jgi:hypothetical protein
MNKAFLVRWSILVPLSIISMPFKVISYSMLDAAHRFYDRFLYYAKLELLTFYRIKAAFSVDVLKSKTLAEAREELFERHRQHHKGKPE